MKLNNTLLSIALPPIVLLVIHIVVTKTGLYDKFWWFDIPMHGIGGILIAISVTVLLQHFIQENKLVLNSLVLKILIIIAITTLFAVTWELMEFFLDTYAHTSLQPSLPDTMKDLCMGIIGANIVTITLWIKSLLKV